MPSIGITGGIACGKSTVTTFLAQTMKTTPFNADQEIAFLLDHNPEVAKEIRAHFGNASYDIQGKEEPIQITSQQTIQLNASSNEPTTHLVQIAPPQEARSEPLRKANRAFLRSQIIADPKAKQTLEEILHPRLREKWHPQAMAALGNPHLLFLTEIPLLYEKNLSTCFDRIIVVAASEHIQLQRLTHNRHLPHSIALQLLNLQMPLAEKIARADYVLWNDGSEEILKQQCDYQGRSLGRVEELKS